MPRPSPKNTRAKTVVAVTADAYGSPLVLLSIPQLLTLMLSAAAVGAVAAWVLRKRAGDTRRDDLTQDVVHLRRRLAASQSELTARERELGAEREELARLDAQLTSAEIERAELRARLARASSDGTGRHGTGASGAEAYAVSVRAVLRGSGGGRAGSPVSNERPAVLANAGSASAHGPVAAPQPADAVADDLERIRGIGPTIAQRLRAHGVHRFCEIMEWDDVDLERVAAAVRAPVGRIRRDRWTEQARELESGNSPLAISA